jgi:CBS domain-containing protein
VKVKDVMTRDVQLVPPHESVQEAARLLADVAVGAVPVGRESRPEGILTDRDILIRLVAEGGDPKGTQVRSIMSADLVTCHEDDEAEATADAMRQRQVRRMPVVDKDGRLVGIVTLSDIARGRPAEKMTREEELREAAGDKPAIAQGDAEPQ